MIRFSKSKIFSGQYFQAKSRVIFFVGSGQIRSNQVKISSGLVGLGQFDSGEKEQLGNIDTSSKSMKTSLKVVENAPDDLTPKLKFAACFCLVHVRSVLCTLWSEMRVG